LQNKKDRDARKLFLVEGEKSFLEVIQSTYELYSMFATHAFLATYPEIVDFVKTLPGGANIINIVDAEELSQMGTLATNMMVIGVFKQKELKPLVVTDEIVLALGDVNDPGNLGTLVRIADWYGIRKIICSVKYGRYL
jgi:TrmH family RNA methyltransferase